MSKRKKMPRELYLEKDLRKRRTIRDYYKGFSKRLKRRLKYRRN